MKVRKGKGVEWPILVMDGKQFMLGVSFGQRKVIAKEKEIWMEALKYGAEKLDALKQPNTGINARA